LVHDFSSLFLQKTKTCHSGADFKVLQLKPTHYVRKIEEIYTKPDHVFVW